VTTHEPEGYDCPFCRLVAGEETEHNRQADVVYRSEDVIAFISPKWWRNNPGHVLVVPNEHVENIYAISEQSLAAVSAVAKKIAIAMRATYVCDGTSTRQHNEPGGDQDVWHFHVHVFPRFVGDELYAHHADCRWPGTDERTPFAEKLRAHLSPST
jgi:histidine triad (HIT) family protein